MKAILTSDDSITPTTHKTNHAPSSVNMLIFPPVTGARTRFLLLSESTDFNPKAILCWYISKYTDMA